MLVRIRPQSQNRDRDSILATKVKYQVSLAAFLTKQFAPDIASLLCFTGLKCTHGKLTSNTEG